MVNAWSQEEGLLYPGTMEKKQEQALPIISILRPEMMKMREPRKTSRGRALKW